MQIDNETLLKEAIQELKSNQDLFVEKAGDNLATKLALTLKESLAEQKDEEETKDITSAEKSETKEISDMKTDKPFSDELEDQDGDSEMEKETMDKEEIIIDLTGLSAEMLDKVLIKTQNGKNTDVAFVEDGDSQMEPEEIKENLQKLVKNGLLTESDYKELENNLIDEKLDLDFDDEELELDFDDEKDDHLKANFDFDDEEKEPSEEDLKDFDEDDFEDEEDDFEDEEELDIASPFFAESQEKNYDETLIEELMKEIEEEEKIKESYSTTFKNKPDGKRGARNLPNQEKAGHLQVESVRKEMAKVISENQLLKQEKVKNQKAFSNLLEQITNLKTTLTESNLIATKSFYAAQLLAEHNLKKEEKIEIINSLSKVKTQSEVQSLFESFNVKFKNNLSNNSNEQAILEENIIYSPSKQISVISPKIKRMKSLMEY